MDTQEPNKFNYLALPFIFLFLGCQGNNCIPLKPTITLNNLTSKKKLSSTIFSCGVIGDGFVSLKISDGKHYKNEEIVSFSLEHQIFARWLGSDTIQIVSTGLPLNCSADYFSGVEIEFIHKKHLGLHDISLSELSQLK